MTWKVVPWEDNFDNSPFFNQIITTECEVRLKYLFKCKPKKHANLLKNGNEVGNDDKYMTQTAGIMPKVCNGGILTQLTSLWKLPILPLFI